MILISEVICKSYRVEIPMETFVKFLERDKEFENDEFLNNLDDFNAENVEYSGHFGPALFFDLACENEHELEFIMQCIEAYMGQL